MAKIFYPNWIRSLSGAFKDIVFVKKQVFSKGNQPPGGYVRARPLYSSSFKNSFTIENQYRMFRVLSQAWKTLSKLEKNTWNNAVSSYKLDYNVSGRNLFFAFFLALYFNSYSNLYPVSQLRFPFSKTYDNREEATFSIADIS